MARSAVASMPAFVAALPAAVQFAVAAAATAAAAERAGLDLVVRRIAVYCQWLQKLWTCALQVVWKYAM